MKHVLTFSSPERARMAGHLPTPKARRGSSTCAQEPRDLSRWAPLASPRRRRISLACLGWGLLAASPALLGGVARAQSASDQPSNEATAPPANPSAGVGVPMYLRPAPDADINSYLPSSSQPKMDGSGDSFDLNRSGSDTPIVISGGGSENVADTYGTVGTIDSDGSIRTAGPQKPVPEFHMVKKGDTLWDISQTYYENPREWPRLWSMNPQVENPHWIYPGDQLRTGGAHESSARTSEDNSAGEGGFVGRERAVPPGTVFLRDQGYIGDPARDVWGELVGAQNEVMMLGKGDLVYLLLNEDMEPRVGQRLTVFHEVRTPKKVPGARKPPGELVKVYGTVRVDAFDRETRVARGILIESLDVVERGAKVGPVGRRFDVVPPKTAAVDLEARVLTSVYPNVYFAQNQVVFIDRGSEDGLVPGNRLRAVRHGDTWRRELKSASKHARLRVPLDDPSHAPAETTPLHGDDDSFPDEVVGEVIVLRTEEYSSICLVVESSRPLQAGEKLVAVSGY